MNSLHSPKEASSNLNSFVSILEMDTDQSDLEETTLCQAV